MSRLSNLASSFGFGSSKKEQDTSIDHIDGESQNAGYSKPAENDTIDPSSGGAQKRDLIATKDAEDTKTTYKRRIERRGKGTLAQKNGNQATGPNASGQDAVTAHAMGEPPLTHAELVDTHLASYPLEGGFDGAERDWQLMSRRAWQFARLTAGFLFFALVIGWALGDALSYKTNNGTFSGWSILNAYPFGIVMFALVVPILILFCGYVLSRAMTTTQAAEAMAAAARVYSSPNSVALQQVETVGSVVRDQMDGLNAGLDASLMRLADAEAMIRKHVNAIETAGTAIELKATGAIERVAEERAKLIDATEDLNTKADGFANAIAERTQANIAAIDEANEVSSQVEERFGERLTGLETATKTALESFGQLVEAFGGSDEEIREKTKALNEATEKTLAASGKSKEAAEAAAKIARESQEATAKALMDMSANANSEAVKKAIAETNEKASEEALSLARAEATKIARAAAESASASANAEIEKIAKEVSVDLEKNATAALETSKAKVSSVQEKQNELSATHQALEAENKRLEKLIEEQKARAERLSKAIATQTESLAKLAEKNAAQLLESSEDAVDTVFYPDSAKMSAVETSTQDNQNLLGGRSGSRDAKANANGAQIANKASDKSAKAEKAADDDKRLSDNFRSKPNDQSLKPLKPVSLSGSGVTNDNPGGEKKAKFVESVKTPRDDLERLSDLAKDLAQSRSHKNSERVTKDHVQENLSFDGQSEPKSGAGDKSANSSNNLSNLPKNLDDSLTLNSTQQPSKSAKTIDRKHGTSWKEILAAADGVPPLDDARSSSEVSQTKSANEKSELEIPVNLDKKISSPKTNTNRNKGSDVEKSTLTLTGGTIDLMPDAAFITPKRSSNGEAISERESRAYEVIHRLQQFTLNLDHRLYGECPPTLLERFQDGDRNIFANRLLRLNETDVKKRIRLESGRDKKFESDIREFLKQFDRLLEEAAQSTSVDEELREYLSSPLGRIYLLIGEIVGYFA